MFIRKIRRCRIRAAAEIHPEERLSINARFICGLLLNRAMLSGKNGWEDGQGRVYAVYPIRRMAEDAACREYPPAPSTGLVMAGETGHECEISMDKSGSAVTVTPRRILTAYFSGAVSPTAPAEPGDLFRLHFRVTE